MYQCVMFALKGYCGLNSTDYTYVNAAYDMLRVYEEDLPLCDDIKQNASMLVTFNKLLLVLLVLFLLVKS